MLTFAHAQVSICKQAAYSCKNFCIFASRYINESNFPTLNGSEAHTQLSVVLVSSEPTLNAKARRKEESRIRREQKLLEKKEQEQVHQIPKLLSSIGLGFFNPTLRLRHSDVTSFCMQ